MSFYSQNGLCYIGGINQDSKIINNAGWKFHISLNDTILGNVQRGWDSIVDILIKYKIQQSKVIKSNYKVYDKQGSTYISYCNDAARYGKKVGYDKL